MTQWFSDGRRLLAAFVVNITMGIVLAVALSSPSQARAYGYSRLFGLRSPWH